MALPSNLTFAEMYERFLVEPLFRPFGEQLVARLARKNLGGAAKVVGVDMVKRYTKDGVLTFALTTNVATARVWAR